MFKTVHEKSAKAIYGWKEDEALMCFKRSQGSHFVVSSKKSLKFILIDSSFKERVRERERENNKTGLSVLIQKKS